MKKLFLTLIVLFAFTLVSVSQIATLYMKDGRTYVERTTDVVLTNAVAQYYIIKAPQDQYTSPCIIAAMDSTSGNASSVTVVLAGRVSDQTDTWTTISTTVWTRVPAVSADTVIIALTAAESAYREYKCTFTPAGTGTTTLTNFEFKQYLGIP